MLRILLAEDDDTLRTHIARMLERGGYAVTQAGRAASALRLIEHQSFDLLLADIAMPEIDGIELAHRAGVLDPALRVMFVTGFAAVSVETDAALGGARSLSKPFHLRDLVCEVDRLLDIGSVAGA